ncbi:zinc-binding alcohol dehydrogenase family protein [Kordiimonas lacus]|uniref:Zinc-type alcohol dehydrogenase-like protein n=1 Tax=Kordiimonas lacus TaxID=637679 RepID=A0A1G7D5E5_9PROT|nr:zinc-binding alcohol dehydrogenase family protein [Kordiimonas lacus]SDE46737.1 zinc-binding alcohol dehydrogenase family protein [Kordiimonas lacus]
MRVFGFDRGLPVTDPQCFLEQEQPVPEPGDHDLLVKVKAVSVNPVDVKVRGGKADDGVFSVIGWDCSGVVEKVGASVTDFQVGDKVWYAGDIRRPGCNAEFHVVDARIVSLKPEAMDFAEAAAMPLTSLTAWEALYDRLRVSERTDDNKGKKFLIINGAGGVGSIAIQLAKRLGLEVSATASRPESQAWCKALGATSVVSYSDVGSLPPDQFDYILCCHDTDAYFDIAANLVKPQGAVCFLASAKVKHDIQLFMHKSAAIAWEFMFTRSTYQTADMARQKEILSEIACLVDDGEMQGTMARKLEGFSAEAFTKAHEVLESGSMIGKLVIEA